jgi:CheY-like chemotaxis protein
LVDDYPDALEIWSLYLGMCGYDVRTAEDGKTALEWAMAEHPDVVVMDLELPGLTGFEVARRLRDSPETREIPMIAATGYSHAHQLDEARRSGFNVIVVKPCDPSVIVAEIERLLAHPEPSSADRQPSATFGHQASSSSH